LFEQQLRCSNSNGVVAYEEVTSQQYAGEGLALLLEDWRCTLDNLGFPQGCCHAMLSFQCPMKVTLENHILCISRVNPVSPISPQRSCVTIHGSLLLVESSGVRMNNRNKIQQDFCLVMPLLRRIRIGSREVDETVRPRVRTKSARELHIHVVQRTAIERLLILSW